MAEFIKYYKLDFAISPLYQEIIPVIYDLFLYVIHKPCRIPRQDFQ